MRRIILTISFAGLALSGLIAAGWSLRQGHTDQAIAFAWPTLALAIAWALTIPQSHQAHDEAAARAQLK